MNEPSIAVIIPIHNESSFLPDAVARLYDELAQVPGEVEVLLAENGSTDDTAAVAAGLATRYANLTVLRHPAADYGAAMRQGFLAAATEWRVLFDIDYFSGAFVNEVIAHDHDADIVLASKRAPGADDRRSRLRRLATRVFNLILRIVFGSRVTDTHGMKAIRRTVVEHLAPVVRSTKDLFDTELVLRAERVGYRIVEVPALVEELRPTDQRLLSRVPRTLAGVARLRWRMWREPDQSPGAGSSARRRRHQG